MHIYTVKVRSQIGDSGFGMAEGWSLGILPYRLAGIAGGVHDMESDSINGSVTSRKKRQILGDLPLFFQFSCWAWSC